jgi:hypothetical protein
MRRQNINSKPKKGSKARKTSTAIVPRTIGGIKNPAILIKAPSSKESYVDIAVNFSIDNAITTPFKVLDPLLGAGGLLRTFPQLCRVAAGGSANTPKWFKNIQVMGIEYQLNFVGSQSNALIAADLYNRCRFIAWATKYPYSATNNATWTLDSLTDWTRVSDLLLDQTVDLVSQAFDSGNYNAPGAKNLRGMIKYNHRYDCKSTTTAGGLPTAFDTDEDNLLFGFVSDSSVAPHPSVTGAIRLLYRELDQ